MSKVPYTINVDEYICTELSRIRDMVKTLDFSGLPATIERIQMHASAMENALYVWKNMRTDINRQFKKEDVSAEEHVQQIKIILTKLGIDPEDY